MKRKVLSAAVAAILTMLLITTAWASSLYSPDDWTDEQEVASQIAEYARALGLPEDDPIIIRAQEIWWAEELERQARFEEDRDIIATLVYQEAWGGCSDRHRELVAAVVVNRVNSDMFPDTVREVVEAQNQYLPAYADANSWAGRAARKDEAIWAECQRIATRALYGEVDCPENVLYQAEGPQGEGTYEIHRTSYSTTYFCYQD